MIKIFKKKRQDLMEKNSPAERADNTGKYLKYAIGEIVLVVIGILIALSLNNWNENRKINIEEILILRSLHDNLSLTKKQSENNILSEKRLKSDLLFLLNYTSNNAELLRPENLDLIVDHGFWGLGSDFPVMNSYSDLKNTGKIGLIKNKNLREKFTSLEVSVNTVTEKITDRLNIHQIRIDDIVEKDINFVLISKSAIPELNIENEKPNDYNLILNNQRIRNLLTIKLRMTQGLQEANKALYLEIVDLLTLIETELNRKK